MVEKIRDISILQVALATLQLCNYSGDRKLHRIKAIMQEFISTNVIIALENRSCSINFENVM